MLSQKIADGKLFVIENFDLTESKTKELLTIINKIIKSEKSAFVINDKDKNILRAGKNVAWLNFLSGSRMNICDLYYSNNILITEEEIKNLNDLLLKIK